MHSVFNGLSCSVNQNTCDPTSHDKLLKIFQWQSKKSLQSQKYIPQQTDGNIIYFLF